LCAKIDALAAKIPAPGMVYAWMDSNMPEWARGTVQKLMDKGLLEGNEKGELGLTESDLKQFVINDRAGLYDN
jgi:N-acetylmuramoyl-L-alanine amidase